MSLLADIGEELYGRHGWQTAMAADRKVTVRTVQRWVERGDAAVPAGIWAELRAQLMAEPARSAAACATLIARLAAAPS